MQEVFEKIIEKLEGQIRIEENIAKKESDGHPITHQYAANCMKVIEKFVKQEAEKFGTDTNVGSNGLIPCSERLPEPIRPVLVTLRNWMNDKYFVRVGRFHTDHWKTDEGIVENSVVLAWQPLPAPYQPKGE